MSTTYEPFTLWTKPKRIVGEIVPTENKWAGLKSISHYEMERRGN